MLIFRLFNLILKIFFLSFFLSFRYFLIGIIKLFYFFLFSPLAGFFLFKSFFLLIFFLLRNLLNLVLTWVSNFYAYIKLVHIREPIQQLFFHLNIFFLFKEKIFRRYYFYRRAYWLSNRSLKALVKAILTVEPNALLVKRLVRPLRSLWPKLLKIPSSRTRVGYRFRVIRRVIKFFTGLVTLFYPIQLLLKFSAWYLSAYLLKFLRFLKRKKILKTKQQIKTMLKFIIWLKLVFVWNELPFILLFKPGVSKKYPQYEDIQPDTNVIRHEVWLFALSRDCYFDYDDVLNDYYLFHSVRRLSKFFFNLVIFFFVAVYFVIFNLLYIIQLFYFLFYIPFKFVYIYHFITALILSLKLVLVFIYLIPILLILAPILLLYLIYRFVAVKIKFFYSQKNLIFMYLFSFDFYKSQIIERFGALLYYVLFKFRSLNYSVFSNIKRLTSINNLFRLDSLFKSSLNKLFNPDPYYANLLYYNTSFVFRRVRPYLLRFNNTQFISYFFKMPLTSRITPDQFKAFLKISLHGRYPIDYFEKLFDLEYSKVELEYELPYYWSFVRQAHSLNQGLLHPKFHVYGFLNFLRFYWNYFSFLNTNVTFDMSSLYAHDFIQLFNSSASQILSLLVNDFVELMKVKKFYLYVSSRFSSLGEGYIKLNIMTKSTQWYTLHIKYYDKLLRFFWDYFDTVLVKIIFYYYFSISAPTAVKVRSFINDYAEKASHNLSWLAFAFYEKIMNKIFLNVNKFEDYYDVNFDKSADRYDFYLSHFKNFFGVRVQTNFLKNNGVINSKIFSENLKNSIRFSDYANKLAAQRKKDYMETMSDFFVGSFSFFGHFYEFVRDNIFEFMTVWYSVWHDYVDVSISNWASLKKINVFLLYFFKVALTIWFCFILIILFSFFFFLKEAIIKIIRIIIK